MLAHYRLLSDVVQSLVTYLGVNAVMERLSDVVQSLVTYLAWMQSWNSFQMLCSLW